MISLKTQEKALLDAVLSASGIALNSFFFFFLIVQVIFIFLFLIFILFLNFT